MLKHRADLVNVGCLMGLRGFECEGRVELHHVAKGSGLRSQWSLVPLCEGHHRGGAGLHGMGVKAFCSLYRPPGESEYGLLIWLLEALADARYKLRAA